MSRSYHVTRRDAVRRLKAEGDASQVLSLLEKRYVKSAVKKLHDLDVRPSRVSAGKIIRRLAPRVAKEFMGGKKPEKFAR